MHKIMGKQSSEDSKKTEQTRQPGKNTLIIALAAVSVTVIVALSITVVMLLNRTPQPQQVIRSADYVSGSKGTVLTQEDLDKFLEELNAPLEDAYYEVTMNTRWVFETAETPSKNAYVENKETNTRTVFFDVILRDTKEIVYTSPYIPVGGRLQGFALDTKLGAGEYDVSVKYYFVDDDYKEITDVSVVAQLIIER